VKYAGFIATESPDLAAASIEFLRDSTYDEEFSNTFQFQIPGIDPITSFPDRDLLRAASFVLGTLKHGDSVDLNVLQSCMIWRDPAIRGNLIRAMGRLNGDPNALLEGIKPFFDDEAPMIRLRAAQAWTQISRDRELTANILNQLNEESPNETPLETMTRLGVQWRVKADVEPLLRAIETALIEEEDEVRLEAVEWLLEIHSKLPSARPLLEKALKDSNGLIRFRAEEALKPGESYFIDEE
jgi:HEAT repeat protein